MLMIPVHPAFETEVPGETSDPGFPDDVHPSAAFPAAHEPADGGHHVLSVRPAVPEVFPVAL